MSHRLAQINKLIKKEINDIILKNLELPKRYLLTLEKVDTKADLKNCDVYISVLPVRFRQAARQLLANNSRMIQSELNDRLHLKFVPKIKYLIDTSEEKADRIYRILDKERRMG